MTETEWAPASCTLPTIERPLREREFTDLFRTALRELAVAGADRADFTLAATATGTARDLAARETSCCSFFTFTFAENPSTVVMTVTVPPQQTRVLDALVRMAAGAAGVTPGRA